MMSKSDFPFQQSTILGRVELGRARKAVDRFGGGPQTILEEFK